jgi:site-specific DNA-methyltransferase (adenine-specific)
MLELNRIYLGNCIIGMEDIEPESVDLVICDPPYLTGYKTNHRADKNHEFCSVIENDSYENRQLITDYIHGCHRILKNDSAMYMFCNADRVDFFKMELEKHFTMRNMIVWVKNNWTAGDLEAQFGKQYELIFLVNKGRAKFHGKRISDVWYADRVSGEKQIHQNQKPLSIIEKCILKHSREGDIVFDGFMGSGTTAIACINNNRNYIGFEMNVKEYKKAIDRINGHLRQMSIFDLVGD